MPMNFGGASFGLLRVPALRPGAAASTLTGPDFDDPAESGRIRAYIRQIVADPFVREAIEVSSGSLARDLAKIDDGREIAFSKLRRVAYAVTKYVLRMSHRPTPFGLAAGVAVARFGAPVGFLAGLPPVKAVRPAMDWLLAAVHEWERLPDVRRRLLLVRNDLATSRGDRLVLPYVRAAGGKVTDFEVSVRDTEAVRVCMDAADRPVSHAELLAELCESFPGVTEETAAGLIDSLVEQEFLVSELPPPPDCADPLGHVIDRLEADHPRTGALREIRTAIGAYAATPPGEGTADLRELVSSMSRLHAGERPLQVDLRAGVEANLPDVVLRELETAVDLLWRMTSDELPDHYAEYHQAFVERYGLGCAVPLGELLDPARGLDAPATYVLPASSRQLIHRPPRPDTARRRRLAELAMTGEEVVLDEASIAALVRHDGTSRPAPDLDVCVTLLADSMAEIERGEFRLVLAAGLGSIGPGSFFGRFTAMFDGLADQIRQIVSPQEQEAVPAQLFYQPNESRSGNVIQVPPILPHRVAVGMYADRGQDGVLGLDDLVVSADTHRLYVHSRSLGREIVPMPFNMLNPYRNQPNVARLLGEIAFHRAGGVSAWSWDGLTDLPYLPRVRYGRTVLFTARWLPAPELRDPNLSWEKWLEALHGWRERWSVPGHVEVVSHDLRLPLDLTAPPHQRLLRRELERDRTAVLAEPPGGGSPGTGWCEGSGNEIVVPLTGRSGTAPATPPSATLDWPRRRHHPGGEWLYAKLFLIGEHQDELLIDRLPALLDRLRPAIDHWHFLRYRDPEPHLRLRVAGTPETLSGHVLPALHDWVAANCAAGSLRRMVLDTYQPEYVRYGGEKAMPAAERFFHADSEAVVRQLGLLRDGVLTLEPELVAAANFMRIARGLGGDDWAAHYLEHIPKGDHHVAFRQHRRAAVRLIDPAGGWTALAAEPGGARLIESWGPLADYAAELESTDPRTRLDIVRSVLHMHANRLLGIDRAAEERAFALFRGVLDADAQRRRFAG
ncbi:thiopeptide-type bacteriocin biosynthesis domain-containing protein [Nonomuraea solani]|uniref:Thiopeptide-type bacteriocin biosynthesis domain-containing protein n=1 Tax=Nonomuraea solani TaxID=1144553 RepID=A0A1H6CRG0_9ACTN|nr:lantibiotic dehydratase [Nonomuraea solani]SEG75571.1 thiopeptide-type bacteriocin biosynthesis domain-containing protein [Nonomuraea solani]